MTDPTFQPPLADHEVQMRAFLKRELDGQLGRSEAAFRQYLSQGPTLGKDRYHVWRLPLRRAGWGAAVIGAALAASLAAVWTGPSLQPALPVEYSSPRISPSMVNNPSFVEQQIQSQTFDDGAILLDGRPVRVLRRRDMERTRWFDAQRHLRSEQVVPEDHVVYVPVKTY